MIGYKLTRATCARWCFLGTTIDEVLATLRGELQADEDSGLLPDELGSMTIEAYETTQGEIDAMPDFEGW